MDGLLLLPRVAVVDYLRVSIQKVLRLNIFLVPIFDPFKRIVMRVKVIAHSEKGGLGEYDFLVFSFLEKKV